MTEKSRYLAEQAAELPPTDRVDLEEDILATLPEDDPDWGAAWAEDRLAAATSVMSRSYSEHTARSTVCSQHRRTF